MNICLLFQGSVVGLKGNAGQCVYSASKAGLEGFTRSLAKEVASRDIRVNLLAPGMLQLHLSSYSTFPLSTCSGFYFFLSQSVISFVLFMVLLMSLPSLASRFHPHRHDRRAEGGRGALYPTGEIWRAGGGSPGCPLPFGVFLRHRTGAGGGWRTAAGHVGNGTFFHSMAGRQVKASLCLFLKFVSFKA